MEEYKIGDEVEFAYEGITLKGVIKNIMCIPTDLPKEYRVLLDMGSSDKRVLCYGIRGHDKYYIIESNRVIRKIEKEENKIMNELSLAARVVATDEYTFRYTHYIGTLNIIDDILIHNGKIDLTKYIEKYRVINDRIVVVTFVDGTTEKAVCEAPDDFYVAQGIELCVLKKAFGGKTAYNRFSSSVDSFIKKNDAKIKAEEKKKAEYKKAEEIRKARLKRRADKKKEIRIKEQEEAYLRALVKKDGLDNVYKEEDSNPS